MIGKETAEGVECNKIKLTQYPLRIDGEDVENVTYYFFDTETNVPIMTESEIKSGQMKGKISQTVFSNYDEVDGLYFPYTILSRLKDGDGQEVTVEKIELNPTVDDAMFKFPEEEAGDDGDKKEEGSK